MTHRHRHTLTTNEFKVFINKGESKVSCPGPFHLVLSISSCPSRPVHAFASAFGDENQHKQKVEERSLLASPELMTYVPLLRIALASILCH